VTITLEFKNGLSSRMDFKPELGLNRIQGSGPSPGVKKLEQIIPTVKCNLTNDTF
jgi:hypothetical protein